MQMLKRKIKIKRKKDAVDILCYFFNFFRFLFYLCMCLCLRLVIREWDCREGEGVFKNWDMLIYRIISELVRNMDRIYCLILIHNTY